MATASSPASLPADCPACALLRACRDEPHPLFVAELASGVLVLHGASAPAGRLQLVAKHHVPDVLALSDAEREALWRDLDLVVRAVRAALAPLRLNMASPADGGSDGHLVWELVPRAGEDEVEAARPWWELPADPLDLDTAAELKRRILRGFLAVSPVRRLAPAPVRRRP